MSEMEIKAIWGNRVINTVIKFTVALLFSWVIYHQVFNHENVYDFNQLVLDRINDRNIFWLISAIVLMPLNWALETFKWMKFTRDFDPIGFLKAYRAVLTGVLFSVFTPNRIGEYGGRILWLKPENQWKGVIATILSSFCQILITLSFGIIGFLYFSFYFLDLNKIARTSIFTFGVLFILTLFFIFYNIDLLVPFAKKIQWIKRFNKVLKHLLILTHYSSKELSMALLIAFFRYSLYCLQYFMVLMFFDVEPPFFTGLACIATFFFLQTSIPLPPMLGLVTRGEIALQIWSHFNVNNMLILASTYTLWVINVLLPSFIGLIFVISINIVKSLGYEK